MGLNVTITRQINVDGIPNYPNAISIIESILDLKGWEYSELAMIADCEAGSIDLQENNFIKIIDYIRKENLGFPEELYEANKVYKEIMEGRTEEWTPVLGYTLKFESNC